MKPPFANLPLALAWHELTVWRSIAYVPPERSGLAQLSDDPQHCQAGKKLMGRLGPRPVAGNQTDYAESVLHWPLRPCNWSASRFSDGLHYGILYAALEKETALAESLYYYRQFFADANIEPAKMPRQQRGLFTFRVGELLADTRKAARRQRQLTADDHRWCRGLGKHLAHHLHSGWLYRSARQAEGAALALLRADHASNVAWAGMLEIDPNDATVCEPSQTQGDTKIISPG